MIRTPVGKRMSGTYLIGIRDICGIFHSASSHIFIVLLSRISSVLGIRKVGEPGDMFFFKCCKSSNNTDPLILKELKFFCGM